MSESSSKAAVSYGSTVNPRTGQHSRSRFPAAWRGCVLISSPRLIRTSERSAFCQSLRKHFLDLWNGGTSGFFRFALAAQPESADWTVRRLADVSGVSKSNSAKIRQQLLAEGLLGPGKEGLAIRDSKELEQQLLRGYEQVLRPKILVDRFRAQESIQKLLLEIQTSLQRVFCDLVPDWRACCLFASALLQRHRNACFREHVAR